MYQAIVFLPLLGAVIAALITLAGAHARHPGGTPHAGAEDHAQGPVEEHIPRASPLAHDAHVALTPFPAEPESHAAPAGGSRAAELTTTVFLFASMLLSWFAFADVGLLHHDSRVALFNWITAGDLSIDWSLRIDSLAAVMLVVVTTISAFVPPLADGRTPDR